MRTYDVVRQWLEAYLKTEREIENQSERVKAISDRMDTVSSPSLNGMPRAPSADPDKIGIMLCREDELLKYLRDIQSLHEEHRHNIEYLVGKLEPDERLVVQMKYLDGATPEETTTVLYGRLADFDVNYSVYLRKMYRVKKRALKAIVRLCDGNESLTNHMVEFVRKTTSRDF